MSAKKSLLALTDIRDAISRIERYTKGKDLADFRMDELVHDAVERCIEIISEASRRIPDELKEKHPEIPWHNVANIGNVLRHRYNSVSIPMLWEVVQQHLPPLKRAVRAMLREVRRR